MEPPESDLSRSRDFWDSVWNKEENRDFWTHVDPEVTRLMASESPHQRPAVLDLGCGLGRNAIAFAQAGYCVTATDVSASAVSHLRQWAGRLGLTVQTHVCPFTADAFPPEMFDIVLSVNVIYHGLPADFARVVGNVRYWLRHRGLFYFTCPTLEDGEYGKGRQVARNTFELEPGHVHFCAGWDDLAPLLDGLRLVSCNKREHRWEREGVGQFSSRWQVLVEKP